MASAVLLYVTTSSLDRWWQSPDCNHRPHSWGGATGHSSCQFLSLKLVASPFLALPHPQVPSCGDLNKYRLTRRNSSSRAPPLAVTTDKILTVSSAQEHPEGLLSPLASPLHPLEVQGLICGPRFPSLPERLGPVPKQLEFRRHSSDPGLAGS